MTFVTVFFQDFGEEPEDFQNEFAWGLDGFLNSLNNLNFRRSRFAF